LQPGEIWIAQGDHHMTVQRDGVSVRLLTNQDPPENSCRPAADVLFRSVAATYGAEALAVVLTGMGYDGLEGTRVMVANGARAIAQDEASSVVWGMPGAVSRAGLAEKTLPLEQIAGEIVSRCGTVAGIPANR
jgi:two-component system, chemotaxis family, protein-glutamate methylesterase/glutaminase